jgi:hypothetical protein
LELIQAPVPMLATPKRLPCRSCADLISGLATSCAVTRGVSTVISSFRSLPSDTACRTAGTPTTPNWVVAADVAKRRLEDHDLRVDPVLAGIRLDHHHAKCGLTSFVWPRRR